MMQNNAEKVATLACYLTMYAAHLDFSLLTIVIENRRVFVTRKPYLRIHSHRLRETRTENDGLLNLTLWTSGGVW